MSQSSQSYSLEFESSDSMLHPWNPEAKPYCPWNPEATTFVPVPASYQVHCLPAPSRLVASAIPIPISHSLDDLPTGTSDMLPLCRPWDDNSHMTNRFEESEATSSWALTPPDCSTGVDFGDFNTLAQDLAHPEDLYGVGGSFVPGHIRDLDDIGNAVIGSHSSQGDDVLRQFEATQSIHSDLVYDHNEYVQSVDSSFTCSGEGILYDYNNYINGEHDFSYDYRLPKETSSEATRGFEMQHLTPVLSMTCKKSSSSEVVQKKTGPIGEISSTKIGVSKSNSIKASRHKSNAGSKPTVMRSSITKSYKKKPTPKKPSQNAYEAIINILSLPISEKQKRATAVIKQQEKEIEEGKKLGQEIRITRTGGRVQIEGVYWRAPQNDDTIPVTLTAKEACHGQILEAMLNNKGCKEVTTSKAFKNRWADGAGHYKAHELQDTVWDIVDAMVDIHENGWTAKVNDSAQRESFQKTMYYSFKDRFDGVVGLLKHSKTTCADIMKGERMWAVLGNPLALEVRTSSNKTSNERKGRKLKKDNKRAREDNAGEESSEAELANPRPMKRMRQARV